MKTFFLLVLTSVLFMGGPPVVRADDAGISMNIPSAFADAAKQWEDTIKAHAVKLFWTLAVIAFSWTFTLLILAHADLADLFGAVTRFTFVIFFFYWILEHGAEFAGNIMKSAQQMANNASGADVSNYNAFVSIGQDILSQVVKKVNIFDATTGLCCVILAILIFIALVLITLNIILVTAEAWIITYAGLIFLGFGASEWSRDMAIGYYKTMLAYGIKLMVTFLLAGIAFNILNTVQEKVGQNWGSNVSVLSGVLAGVLVLLGVIAKAPEGVASITGVSTGGFGHGVNTFMRAAGIAYQAGSMATGAAAEGGKQLGSAVRAAVKRGQALSRGKR
jgi:type IV secretion system protein TrbL